MKADEAGGAGDKNGHAKKESKLKGSLDGEALRQIRQLNNIIHEVRMGVITQEKDRHYLQQRPH